MINFLSGFTIWRLLYCDKRMANDMELLQRFTGEGDESRTPDISPRDFLRVSRFFSFIIYARVRTQTCPLFWTPGILTGYACPPRGRFVPRSSQPGKSARCQ